MVNAELGLACTRVSVWDQNFLFETGKEQKAGEEFEQGGKEYEFSSSD